jgi:hypothetical protein
LVRVNEKSELEFRHRRTSLQPHQNNLIPAKFHTAGTPKHPSTTH